LATGPFVTLLPGDDEDWRSFCGKRWPTFKEILVRRQLDLNSAPTRAALSGDRITPRRASDGAHNSLMAILGHLTLLIPRTVWTAEAQHFTPWLACPSAAKLDNELTQRVEFNALDNFALSMRAKFEGEMDDRMELSLEIVSRYRYDPQVQDRAFGLHVKQSYDEMRCGKSQATVP